MGSPPLTKDTVVYRQAVLGKPAREELPTVARALGRKQHPAEYGRQSYVRTHPDRGFPHRRLMGSTADDQQVGGEDHDDGDEGNRPHKRRDMHPLRS